MNKKVLTVSQILCIILAAALLVSVAVLVFTGSKNAALKEELELLNAQVAELEQHNMELLDQLNASGILPEADSALDDLVDYSALDIDGWNAQDGTLTVTGFVHVGMFSDTLASAHLELRKGDEVLQTLPLELKEGEAEDVYEAELTGVSFRIPALSANEELQLWLVVQPENSSSVSSFGAGWYQADGQLMLITG